MKTKRLLIMLGSVCLALMLALPLVASCGPATPEEATEEIAALESKLSAEKAKVSGLQGDVSDLEDEIAALRAPAGVIKILTECAIPSGFYLDATECFAESLEEASGGRMQVEIVLGEAIAPTAEHLKATGDGIFDMLSTWEPYFREIVPVLDIINYMTICLETREDWYYMLEQMGWADQMRQAYAEWNVHWIFAMPEIPSAILVSRVPIPSIDDLEGLKIRATGNSAKAFETLGAGTVFLPGEEIYTALATGLVDAAAYSGPATSYDFGWYEVTKYWIRPAVAKMCQDGISANMDFWNSLSEADQALIDKVTRYALLKSSYEDGWKSQEAWGKARDQGIVVQTWDEESVKRYIEAGLSILPEPRDEAATLAREQLFDYMRMVGYID